MCSFHCPHGQLLPDLDGSIILKALLRGGMAFCREHQGRSNSILYAQPEQIRFYSLQQFPQQFFPFLSDPASLLHTSPSPLQFSAAISLKFPPLYSFPHFLFLPGLRLMNPIAYRICTSDFKLFGFCLICTRAMSP